MIYTFLLPDETLVSFNSVTEFTENQSGNISTYETESGFPISDNIVFENPMFNMSGILSYFNTPTREIVLLDGEFQVIEGAVGVETHIELEGKIRDIFRKKQPFTILKSTDINDIFGTEVERVESCLIGKLSFPYTAEQTGAVYPKMTITQITVSKVVEEDVPNATPQVIPLKKVATKEQVAQAKEAGATKMPDGDKATDPTTTKKAFENDPEAEAQLQKRLSVSESNMNYANAIRERARLIREGASPSSVFVVATGNGGYVVRRSSDYYGGR